MEYVIETIGLCKHYRRLKILNDLVMHVPKGSIYGLVGKNGTGKTTLIRILCGLQKPTSGEYSLYDKNWREKGFSLIRRRMGAVVESPALYLDMTAIDNLKVQCRILGLPDDGGISELLHLVGLENTGKKKVKNFSLGMRQRLGIAVALCGNPDILVLDEPLNGLDPQGIIEIRELILKLNREYQITVLISSHILGELSKLATHYGFIDGGHMAKEISCEELERVCRKCMQVHVTDTKALTCILDDWAIEYSIVDDNSADIYGSVNISELVWALTEKNCQLLSIKERDESLESYYINLIGGERNA